MNKNSLGILLVALGLLFSCVNHDTFNSKIQLNKDVDSISSFLAKNNITAIQTSEGLFYTIDTAGLGVYPVLSDSVNIEYSVSSISYNSQNGYTLARLDTTTYATTKTPYRLLSSLIAGVQIGLSRFPVDSYGRLYVPSGLAFGTTGNGTNILGNTNLLFKIKVVNVKGNQFATDTAAVTKYLGTIANSLLVDKRVLIKDLSGIWYWYDTLYSGAQHPDLGSHSKIDVTYKAKLLNSDTTHFAHKSVKSIDLKDQTDLRVIAAWKIILPKISQGSTVTMYVPSGYGYGSALNPPDATIASNSNLIYEIKLDSVY